MLSQENKFIFVHIPKTGGTSIEHALQGYGKVLQGPKNFGSVYYKHATAGAVQQQLGPAKYDEFFKFTFVRNPWDWIVSQYAFNRGFSPPYVFGTPHRRSSRVRNEHRKWSFSDWLPWWITNLSPSQTSMLVDDQGQLIVDAVGHFEHLDNDFREICTMLSVPVEPLPHLKPSRRCPAAEYYNNESRRLVVEKFRTDFELFGYPLEPHANLS